MTYFLLAVNIILMSIGQLFFKQAAIFLNHNPNMNILTRYFYNPSFYAAILFFAIATFTWVQILTKMKISVAYSILSISYIITAVGAYYLFGEKLSPTNIAGIFVIMLGVSLISVK
jgi:multidrug transporter EmrE-like cation transporter